MPKYRILFATCDHLSATTTSDQVLKRALEARGASVGAMPWSSIDPKTTADLIVLRSTWDYHKRIKEFRTWLTEMEAAGRRILNPVPTVRWNLDKAYLQELEGKGIAIPVTRLEDRLTPERLDIVLTEEKWSAAVVKPRVSATAHGTFLVRRGTPVTNEQLAPAWEPGALVQQFVKEVASHGELSLMFFGGEYSHAAIKRPKAGDFRVQTDFGGSSELVEPSQSAIGFARNVLNATPYPWTYARVDLVETETGPLLMELELIEPHLFFDTTPAAAEILATLLLGRRPMP